MGTQSTPSPPIPDLQLASIPICWHPISTIHYYLLYHYYNIPHTCSYMPLIDIFTLPSLITVSTIITSITHYPPPFPPLISPPYHFSSSTIRIPTTLVSPINLSSSHLAEKIYAKSKKKIKSLKTHFNKDDVKYLKNLLSDMITGKSRVSVFVIEK